MAYIIISMVTRGVSDDSDKFPQFCPMVSIICPMKTKKATTITGSRSYLYMSNLYFLTVAFT
jgi:hypothetical protein